MSEDVLIRLRLGGQRAVESGLHRVARGVRGVGSVADTAGRRTNMAFNGMGRGLATMTRYAGYGAVALGGAAVGGLAYAARETYTELNRIERIGAQTKAVISSTGNAARVSATHTLAYADRLESMTSVESEAIQEGQNLLRTFTRVQNGVGKGNRVFDRATKAFTDVSVAMGTEPRQAALQLGRALNDPIRGLTSLGRAGIQFSDEQRRRIRGYVEEGRVAKAQGVILRELERQFGGSGRALGQTRSGRVRILGHRFGQIQEGLLAPTLPMMERALDEAEPLATRFAERVNGAMSRQRLAFGDRVRLVWRGTRRDLQPYLADVQQWMDQAELGDRLAEGVERATPVILDAAAASAGKAGETFVKAWLETGPWGKLLTAAFVMSKTRGVWGPVGRLSASMFTRTWGRRVSSSPTFTTVGRTAGMRTAAATATGAAAGMPAAFASRQAKWTSVGATTGRTLGTAAGRGAAVSTAAGMVGPAGLGAAVGGRTGRLRAVGRSIGTVVGRAAGPAAAAFLILEMVDPVNRKLREMFPGQADVLAPTRGEWQAREDELLRRHLNNNRPDVDSSHPTWTRPNPFTAPLPPLRRPSTSSQPMQRRQAGRRDVHVHLNVAGREMGRALHTLTDDDDQWR